MAREKTFGCGDVLGNKLIWACRMTCEDLLGQRIRIGSMCVHSKEGGGNSGQCHIKNVKNYGLTRAA